MYVKRSGSGADVEPSCLTSGAPFFREGPDPVIGGEAECVREPAPRRGALDVERRSAGGLTDRADHCLSDLAQALDQTRCGDDR